MSKKKKEFRELVFEYDADDACGVIKLEDFFKRHVEAGDRIPARAIRILLSKVRIKEERLNTEVEELIGRVKQAVLDRYGRDKDYQFTFTYEIPYTEPEFEPPKLQDGTPMFTPVTDGKPTIETVTFQRVIDQLFHWLQFDYLEIVRTEKDRGKQKLVQFVYGGIQSGIRQAKNPPLNPYQIGSITGYVLWRLGFHLAGTESFAKKGKEPSNNVLYNGVKYPIKIFLDAQELESKKAQE